MSAKTSYGCHLRQSASSIQMNVERLTQAAMYECTCWKPTCQARKEGSTPAGLSGSCLCPISLDSSILWGKGNDFPSSNTFKQHQENGRHMQCLHVSIFLHRLSQCYLKCWMERGDKVCGVGTEAGLGSFLSLAQRHQ